MAKYYGTAVHKGLGEWYRGDEKNDEKGLRAFGEEYAKWYDGKDEGRTAENGYYILREYFNRFREDYLKTVEVEIKFVIEMGEVMYSGIIDRLCEWEGEGLVIEDWKSTKWPGSGFVLSEPNNQFTGYLLGAREIIGKGIKTVFVTQIGTQIKNKTRKSKNNPEPEKEVTILRDPSIRSQEQFEEFRRELELTVGGIEWCRSREMWPKHTNWCPSFNGCEFILLCKAAKESVPYLVESLYRKVEGKGEEVEVE